MMMKSVRLFLCICICNILNHGPFKVAEASTPTLTPTQIDHSWEMIKSFPCKGIFPSTEGKKRSRCKLGLPKSAKRKNGNEPILDRGYYNLNLDTCLKHLRVVNETNNNEPILESASQCTWYWCAAENGCVRASYGKDCTNAEEFWYTFFTFVMFATFTCCLIIPFLFEYEDEILMVITLLSFICGIIFSIAWTECDNTYPFIVAFEGGNIPTPSPTTQLITPTPTLTRYPTAQPTWIPGYLSENIEFKKTELKIVSIIFFVILGIFSLVTFSFVVGLGNMTKMRKFKIFITLLFSQLDVLMDVSYSFYSKFANPFLRLLSLIFLFLPFSMICCFHCKKNLKRLSQVIAIFIEIRSRYGITQHSSHYITTLYQADKTCKFGEFSDCIIWMIGKSVLLVLDIIVSSFLILGCLCRILFEIIYGYFFIVSKLSILDAGSGEDNDNKKNGNFKFNEALFMEIVFESIPQLIIASINEVALQDDKNKLSTLFLLQITTSSAMIINEIWPMMFAIANHHCKVGEGLASRILFPPSSTSSTTIKNSSLWKKVTAIDTAASIDITSVEEGGKVGSSGINGATTNARVEPSSMSTIPSSSSQVTLPPLSSNTPSKVQTRKADNDSEHQVLSTAVEVELVNESIREQCPSSEPTTVATDRGGETTDTERREEEYQYRTTSPSTSTDHSKEYVYSGEREHIDYEKQSKVSQSHIIREDGTIDIEAMNAEIDNC